MIIGITQRVDKVSAYNEYRDALDQRLVNWVIEAGFTPVPIPNTLVDKGFPNKICKCTTIIRYYNTHLQE